MNVIETHHLTKRYNHLLAVDDVNLEVEEGECFGLLGPNGAGKTSLIRMITAVSPPTGGDIRIMGYDLKVYARKVKAIMGVVPQIDNLDPDLSVSQNLTTFARYFDIPGKEARRRCREVLALFELEPKSNSRIRELSGGMKRRLLLARGLINMPRIVILDEPTVGLDPQGKHLVWNKLRELKREGITELLCTQNMEEAYLLCDRVAIMHRSKILTVDRPAALISRYAGELVAEIRPDVEPKSGVTGRIVRGGLDYEDRGDRVIIFNIGDETRLEEITGSGAHLERRPGTLEDVFLRLTGSSLNE